MSLLRRILGGSSRKAEYDQLVARAMSELRIKTAAAEGLFGLGHAKWDVDQDKGTITFTGPAVTATCSVQIVGTYNPTDGTWLWGWDHPSVIQGLHRTAAVVRDWGTKHDVNKLTTRKVRATQDECWEFAAVACSLTEAQGAYRGPAGSSFVFVTFDDVQLSGGGPNVQVAIGLPLTFGEQAPKEAVEAALGFIADHHVWEKEVWAQPESERTHFATGTYAKMIERWCCSSVEPQPVSYASQANWAPGTYEVVGGAAQGERCSLLLHTVDETGFETDHEIHLRRTEDRWLITSVLYISGPEKYECL